MQLSRIIIRSLLKTANVATFLINFEYRMSTRMLYICIKYSTCDQICDSSVAVFEVATWV